MEVISDSLKLVIENEGFRTLVLDEGEWREGTQAYSLPLDQLSPERLTENGYAGSGDGYAWDSTFAAEHGGFWLRTHLQCERVMTFTPSMLLWIDRLDDMDDRQGHTWRQTVLRAPTVNAGGLGGNDLPACYLYDHNTHIETVCFYPPEAFAWSARRFCDFSMSEVLRYQPDARYGLGLHLNPPTTAIELSAGEHEFVWWFTQRPRGAVPTPWEAQRALIEAVAPLLDPVPQQKTNTIPWSQMALNTQDDLLKDKCWITVNGLAGLRAYVRGSSTVGRDKARGFELMTQLDVLYPLLLWERLTGDTTPDVLVQRLLATLPEFDRPLHLFVANNFPPREGDTFMDTWYFLENALIKLAWVAHLTDSVQLRALFLQAMEGARRLAHNCSYLFPLFADAADWRGRGSLLNVGVGGLYAAGCVLASQMFGERAWIAEAAQALRTLYALPPHQLTHEPQQLSWGAAAAKYLSGLPSEKPQQQQWNRIAADLVSLSLRMGYWGRDAHISLYDPRGMFQACASLCYPAFKENVETLLPWSEILASEDDTAFDPLLTGLMASFANLASCHNYAFFDPYLPSKLHQGPCPAIPYEDLATTEFPHTAELGKELYGAGEVFWSALLFDSLGQADADGPDILCLSLDVPSLNLGALPSQSNGIEKPAYSSLRFLLYNPSNEERKTRISTTVGVREVHLQPRACVRLSVSSS